MKPRKTPPTRGLVGIAMHALFSGLSSSYAALCFILLSVVVSAKHGLPLNVEIQLTLNAINPYSILTTLHPDGDSVSINSDGLSTVAGGLPLPVREPLPSGGAVSKLSLPQLRVHVIIGQLTGANTTNSSNPIV